MALSVCAHMCTCMQAMLKLFWYSKTWENLEWWEAIEIVYRKTLNKTTLKRTKLSNCLAKYFRYYRNNNHRIVTVYERSPPSIYTIPGSTSWPFCSACILVFWCKSFESLLLRVAWHCCFSFPAVVLPVREDVGASGQLGERVSQNTRTSLFCLHPPGDGNAMFLHQNSWNRHGRTWRSSFVPALPHAHTCLYVSRHILVAWMFALCDCPPTTIQSYCPSQIHSVLF